MASCLCAPVLLPARLDQDRRADALLDLDGQVFVVDPKGEYLVRFVVRRVEPSPERPHGLNNAHPVRESRRPGGAAKDAYDHRHRMDRVRPYRFRDAVTLVEDSWVEVDRFLKEKGVV